MWPLYSLICSQLLHTLNSQLCWMGNCTSWILSHTGIYPSMPVANISYGKNAAPCTQHCCCQWRLGSYHSTMKMPGDTQWLISFGNRAHYLDITPLIHNIRWKGEWRNFGRLWRKDEMRTNETIICDQFPSCSSDIYVPFTCNLVERDTLPALLEAVHVYVPLWRYPTLLIISTLIFVPNMVVVMEGSDDTTSPFSDQ